MPPGQIDPAIADIIAQLERKPEGFKLKPVLASSLLDSHHADTKRIVQAGGSRWTTGIPVIDEELSPDLWLGGHPISIASVDTGAPGTLNIATEIIASHLIEQARAPPNPHRQPNDLAPQTTVFIIAPPQQGTAAIQRIYTALSARLSKQTQRVHYSQTLPSLPPLHAKTLLNSVSLLQYLDLLGLLETLLEANDTLTSKPYTLQRTIFYLTGLHQTLNTNLRRRGLLHSTSLLQTALQSIHHIARHTHGKCLILVDTEVAWGSPYIQFSRATEEYQKRTGTSTRAHQLMTGALSLTGLVLRYNTHNRLAWILEGGVDVVVAVHEGEGMIDFKTSRDRFVEVVRDERLRNRSGRGGIRHAIRGWCVWKGGPMLNV